MEHKNGIKITIIVLTILLALSLLALGGILIYKNGSNSTVTVPDNIITPDGSSDTTQPNTQGRQAKNIELYSKHDDENTTFNVGNMLPGDSETKYYRVRISYHDVITMNFKATVRSGYEKLAEVLKVRINLPAAGETLYDGVMAEMPESVTYKITSKASVTDELYYEVTTYLETSVGNEYQNENLTADFRWWVNEPQNLDRVCKICDILFYLLLALIVLCTVGIIIYLIAIIRKRKEDEDGEGN